MIKRCSKCGEAKGLVSFHKLKSSNDGHRPDCKDCCKKQREQKKFKDIVRYKTDIMGHSLFTRIKYNTDSPKNKSYKEKNIKIRIGETPKQVSDFLYDNYYDDIRILIDSGKTPSVDRIDSNKDYTPDNIRILEWNINVIEGAINASIMNSRKIKSIKDNQIIVYGSISDASRELCMKRDTIYAHLDKGTSTRNGYKFESIN